MRVAGGTRSRRARRGRSQDNEDKQGRTAAKCCGLRKKGEPRAKGGRRKKEWKKEGEGEKDAQRSFAMTSGRRHRQKTGWRKKGDADEGDGLMRQMLQDRKSRAGPGVGGFVGESGRTRHDARLQDDRQAD